MCMRSLRCIFFVFFAVSVFLTAINRKEREEAARKGHEEKTLINIFAISILHHRSQFIICNSAHHE